ncbi:uncharacterized protein BJ171DRAFT_191939 [Polychytrium aggregatum]|uniref:uncharacterized protein n=1 Tax=Polychytrium aggregatum TaxID=110093 RepID=UPI0022FF0EC5|nr:uncharacterized protein BJ171DRAFT_191939 [Polychytrium aggregatum]KAI9202136.1 hypothetical protein BJ171DRAFT_191939 [Polychytrium aggregatum]
MVYNLISSPWAFGLQKPQPNPQGLSNSDPHQPSGPRPSPFKLWKASLQRMIKTGLHVPTNFGFGSSRPSTSPTLVDCGLSEPSLPTQPCYVLSEVYNIETNVGFPVYVLSSSLAECPEHMPGHSMRPLSKYPEIDLGDDHVDPAASVRLDHEADLTAEVIKEFDMQFPRRAARSRALPHPDAMQLDIPSNDTTPRITPQASPIPSPPSPPSPPSHGTTWPQARRTLRRRSTHPLDTRKSTHVVRSGYSLFDDSNETLVGDSDDGDDYDALFQKQDICHNPQRRPSLLTLQLEASMSSLSERDRLLERRRMIKDQRRRDLEAEVLPSNINLACFDVILSSETRDYTSRHDTLRRGVSLDYLAEGVRGARASGLPGTLVDPEWRNLSHQMQRVGIHYERAKDPPHSVPDFHTPIW